MRGIEKLTVKPPQRSLFDKSHEWKSTIEAGWLYPIWTEEILPGSKYMVNHELYIRCQPLIAPLMHRIRAFVHSFYVMNKTICTGTSSSESMNAWERIITGGEDGDDTTVMPYVTLSNANKSHFQKGGLTHSMGIQPLETGTTYTNSININSLPFRAYQKIWEEYYRDPNIQDTTGVDYSDTGEEGDYSAIITRRKRLWLKDYFTTATPYAVRGVDSGIPLDTDGTQSKVYLTSTGGGPGSVTTLQTDASGNLEFTSGSQDAFVNVEDGTTIDVRELRNSLRVTEWLEKNLKAGGRYVDQILVHWGVQIPDLNYRPKYLGGGEVTIQINEVLNTSDTANAEQGNPAGTGIGYGRSTEWEHEFPDHGWVISLLSIMVENGYSQGLPRKFTRMEKFDYAWPTFASIGDQEIWKNELYLDSDLQGGESVEFGYTGRYQEYKESYNWACGGFYDDYDHWCLNRQFSALPSLNETFLKHDPRLSDVFPTSITSDWFLVQSWNSIRAQLPLPYESMPGIV